ncbi:DEAD/DEAH box helicase [Enterovibrio sp. ZSDZ42]|uniref:DEAD/DEAH box helicase n=1 Tax=Enterovibrio gelatinilyticus TaxID=2899819 RepID=A0ABT5QYQ9_9GAMM|nr:DEAD/DEAH box helicase [Enterovibrio sp. ZSDZ42]MDD1793157.1 DEAD/DEAH box helicase [Enterovibrio sp. ZSDZ42]
MLPSVVSEQVVKSLRKYVKSAFNMNNPYFESEGHSMMDRFLSEQENLVKGPYLSIQLPFRQSHLPLDFFENLELPFPPYAHQAIAYQRLSTEMPKPTLVATGTGSGKTECFLYPLLNYCAGQKNKGVKAIVIYPMNALATDQAKRFASTIYKDKNLQGNVQVGLFVGGEQRDTAVTNMGPQEVITCKHHLRKNPPDILLTNYKMLDYLLMRPEDQSLWEHNEPGTLKYLVVDELHTFDGAQGSDLACLIRRLKYHLSVDNEGFACVGTSATVGDNVESLLEYASNIFDSKFDESSVVREDRYLYEEYLKGASVDYFSYPSFDELERLCASAYLTEVEYLNAQLDVWFPDAHIHLPEDIESDAGRLSRIELGKAIVSHRFFHSLLQMMNGKIASFRTLSSDIGSAFSISEADAGLVIQSFCSLVSIARNAVEEANDKREQRLAEGKPRPVLPFLQVRHQLWFRELRRLVASVNPEPHLNFGDDISDDMREKFLPVINCRDCHATGWGGFVKGQVEQLDSQLDVFYRLFFGGNHSVRVAFPIEEDRDTPNKGQIRRLCTKCLSLNSDAQTAGCKHCDHSELVRVFLPDLVKISEKKGPHFSNDCPYCQSKNGLSIVGAQSATLSAVAINQLYSSRYNENKKLITFSDSVQDAAHRAGFFASRTWPLMMRGHMGTVAQHAEGMSLYEFAQKVVQAAKDKCGSSESFAATFIAPNMEWLNDYREMVESGKPLPAGSLLPTLIEKRLNWEVFSEFGLRASFGRTLEKTGEYTTDVCSQHLIELVSRLHAALIDELGAEIHGVNDEDVLHFCLGVLQRMRHKGAVIHDSLSRYISDGGETYYLTKIDKQTSKYMPNWGNKTRTPAFLTFEKNKRFDQIVGSKSKHSWYQNWLIKCFGKHDNIMIANHTQTIYKLTLDALRRGGILRECDAKHCKVWGIEPSALRLSTTTVALGCDTCSEQMIVAEASVDYWKGQPCSRESCIGHLSIEKSLPEKEWSHSQVCRVNAAEHTGLLERTVREQTENAFINGGDAWSVNLLSATPTLEMGIDIGDLSSVLLCSVPPAQANYLQRIGRAGRKDGNAFNMTVAEGNPHDLFYFEEPVEMMAGSVNAPGVFLDASAILERQLTAFCMDRWIKTGIDGSAISKRVKQMLDATEAGLRDQYPYNFLDFVDSEKESLFTQFTQVFHALSPSSYDKLKTFIIGSSQEYGLAPKIQEALEMLVKDRKSLKHRAEKLKRSIDKLKSSPIKDQNYASDLSEFENERNALLALLREINGKSTLNFMTDEGLLPNYAFPEAGITLRSVLWRKKDTIELEDGKSQYVTSTFEYERPAAAAISELAPTNYFYAGGHKVEVEQIDMKVSEPETWRVCSHCNHSELLESDQFSTCPKCGHPGWSDSEQKMRMLKLRQVYARSSVRDSKITDDADTRTPAFFQRQMLVSFRPEDVEFAYQVQNKSIPFGFEYIRKVAMRDINFGSPIEEANEFYVAGEKKKKSGFKVCADCGFVQKGKGPENHDISCKYRGTVMEAKYEDFLFLYRQLESEAIRILLPVSGYGNGQVTEASLSAALQLGMKRYFKGSVEHIKGTIYREPEDAGESYRHYLVIYDSVPGGTGALKELMQEPANLLSLLNLALEVIEHCGCASEGKDGCYQCVYAYRDRGKMRSISREHARGLLKSILDDESALVKVNSLSDISINKMLESELEKLFVETLQQSVSEFVVTKEYLRGKAAWIVSSKLNNDATWHLVPQENLGEKEGVYIDTRPDFILYPSSDLKQVKPIAVYLDGFVHHYNIVHDDAEKRNAVLDSQKYNVWTLCWNDLAKPDDKHVKDVIGLNRQDVALKDQKGHYSRLLTKNYQMLRSSYENQNSFSLLKRYLHDPQTTSSLFQQAMFANSFYWLAIAASKDVAKKNKFEYEMRENSDSARLPELCLDVPYFFGGLLDSINTSQRSIELAAVMPVEVYINAVANKVQGQTPFVYAEAMTRLHACFDDRYPEDDGYEQALYGYWKLVNLAQFMSDFSFTSRKLLESGSVNRVIKAQNVEPEAEISGLQTLPDEWAELIELEVIDESIAFSMIEHDISAPEVGFSLVSEEGEIIAEAELAWLEEKVAVLLPEMGAFKEQFAGEGWRVIVGELTDQTLQEIKQFMGNN